MTTHDITFSLIPSDGQWYKWNFLVTVSLVNLSLKSVFLLEVQEYDCRNRSHPATKFLLQTVQVFSFI